MEKDWTNETVRYMWSYQNKPIICKIYLKGPYLKCSIANFLRDTMFHSSEASFQVHFIWRTTKLPLAKVKLCIGE